MSLEILDAILKSEYREYASSDTITGILDQCAVGMTEQKVKNVSSVTSKNVYGHVLQQYNDRGRLADSVEFSAVTRDASCYVINGERFPKIKGDLSKTSQVDQDSYVTNTLFPFFIQQLKSIDPTLSDDLCYRIFVRVLSLCNPLALGLFSRVLGCYNRYFNDAVTSTQDPIPNKYIISKSKSLYFMGKTEINLKCFLYFQSLLEDGANSGETFEIIIDYGNLLTLDGKPLNFLPKFLITPPRTLQEVAADEKKKERMAAHLARSYGGKRQKKIRIRVSKKRFHSRKSRRKNKSRRRKN